MLKREEKIKNMPDISGEDRIYLCSPVWGGGFSSAMRYFVKHADFAGKAVKLLLTCNTVSDSYVKGFEKQLNDVGVTLAGNIVFSGKRLPSRPRIN